jgi:hypothetical protein
MTIISILIIRGQYRLGVRSQAKLGGILYMRLTVGPSHHPGPHYHWLSTLARVS